MKAVSWTAWERYLPSKKAQTRTGAAAICMKPWDQILPEEGVEERLACKEQLWRAWERYLPLEKSDASMLQVKVERPERALV